MQYVIIPLALSVWILVGKNKSISAWLLKVLFTGLYLLVLKFTGSFQKTIGYYTFYIVILFYLVSLILSIGKIKDKPFLKNNIRITDIVGYAIFLTLIAILVSFNISIIKAFSYDVEPVYLEFPLKDGTYLITSSGGNGEKCSLVNYHYQDKTVRKIGYYNSMKYANDIEKLNKFGFYCNSFELRKQVFLPDRNEGFEIFGETIYSPCDGEVLYVSDGYDDELPAFVKRLNNVGNGIVIKYDNVYIMIWHLKKDSILVARGDKVTTGQAIGSVGNSGHSQKPHLHIQASVNDWLYGDSIPIIFDDKFPIKNSLYIK